MGLKPRASSSAQAELKSGVSSLRWIGEAKGGSKTPDNEFPEVAKGVVLAIMTEKEELLEGFDLWDVPPESVELNLNRANVVEAGPSVPGWNTYEVHIPWKADAETGVVYSEIDGGLSCDGEVLTSIRLLRVVLSMVSPPPTEARRSAIQRQGSTRTARRSKRRRQSLAGATKE